MGAAAALHGLLRAERMRAAATEAQLRPAAAAPARPSENQHSDHSRSSAATPANTHRLRVLDLDLRFSPSSLR
ncbi:hypothetical protein MHYP_G00022200 [Metynnis hypsauchen]